MSAHVLISKTKLCYDEYWLLWQDVVQQHPRGILGTWKCFFLHYMAADCSVWQGLVSISSLILFATLTSRYHVVSTFRNPPPRFYCTASNLPQVWEQGNQVHKSRYRIKIDNVNELELWHLFLLMRELFIYFHLQL